MVKLYLIIPAEGEKNQPCFEFQILSTSHVYSGKIEKSLLGVWLLFINCCFENSTQYVQKKMREFWFLNYLLKSIYLECLQAEGRRVNFLTSRDNLQHFYFNLKNKIKEKKQGGFIELPWSSSKKIMTNNWSVICHYPAYLASSWSNHCVSGLN